MMGRLRRWHRVAISAVALAILLIFIPVRALLTAMGQVPAASLTLTLAVFLLGHVGAALKWRLLQGRETGLPVLLTLRAHFSGVLANLWLPGVVGGDLVRAGVAVRQSGRPAAVAAASLVDRIIDSIALVLLALVGLIGIGGPAHDARRVFAAILVTVVAGLLVLVAAYRFLGRRAGSPRLGQLRDAIQLLLRRPAPVFGAFFMSLSIQSAFILVNAQLGRAVGVDVSAAVWFMAWPLSKLVALAPISVAGLGVREAAIVMLMRPFNASPDAVMASSLLWQGLLFTGGFIGWGVLSIAPVVWATGRQRGVAILK
jgi:uncharacterized membrane protein YbhN (UPF0104 family)